MTNQITYPVLNVRLVDISMIEANDYNPNVVASPELDLLELSIREDGFTQPLVCYYNEYMKKYILVDGFHRYRVASERLDVKLVPVVVIDKPLDQRMASTIRHNRARGTHGVEPMKAIIRQLVQKGWDEPKIAEELGMELEEIVRFKQSTGLKEAFSNHEFSSSWLTFEERYYHSDK